MRLSAFAVALAGAAAGAPDPPPHRSPLKQAASPFGFKVGNAQREQIADKTAAAVRRDTRQNFRISGLFEDLEKEDKRVQKKINADRNLMAFLQVGKVGSSWTIFRGSFVVSNLYRHRAMSCGKNDAHLFTWMMRAHLLTVPA